MAASTVADVLRAALAILSKKGAWTQGTWARGKSGQKVDIWSRSAVCFCAGGALRRAASAAGVHYLTARDTARDAERALIAVVCPGAVPGGVVADWNDSPSRRKSEVLAAFRKAIAAVSE